MATRKTIILFILSHLFVINVFSQKFTDVSPEGVKRVSAMITDTVKNILYAAGEIKQLNGADCGDVIQFDGNKWSAVGNIKIGYYILGSVGMVIFKGELYIYCPDFVSKWDGNTWITLAKSGKSDSQITFYAITSLTVFKDELYLAANVKDDACVMKFDGKGFNTQIGSLFDGKIYSLINYKNELYAGGGFKKCGKNEMLAIARFKSDEWTPVTDQLVGSRNFNSQCLETKIGKMIVYKDELYASAAMLTVEGTKGKGPHNLKWDGSNWSIVEEKWHIYCNNPIFAGLPGISEFKVFNNELYAVSIWLHSSTNLTTRQAVLKLVNNNWEKVFAADNNKIEAIENYKNELYFGGSKLGELAGIKSKSLFKYSKKE